MAKGKGKEIMFEIDLLGLLADAEDDMVLRFSDLMFNQLDTITVERDDRLEDILPEFDFADSFEFGV